MVNMIEVLFVTSASVLALYFAVLAIIVGLRGRKEFIPVSSRGFATLSLGALTVVCVASLIALLFAQFCPTVDLKWVSLALSIVFIVGIAFILISLQDIVKRL